MTPAEVEKALKSITDRLDHLDPLIEGKEHMYFRCLHSRMLFPADYIDQWGLKYGLGLGGDPRSECLDTEYNIRPDLTKIKRLDQIMHPCKVSGAPLDVVFSAAKAPKRMMLVTNNEDRDGAIRGKIVRDKQMVNPRSEIKALIAIAQKEGLLYA